jgi:hypothetical protein
MKCRIRVIKDIEELYHHCRPRVGKVYNAEYIPPYEGGPQNFKAICFINVSGKRIVLREGEFEKVEVKDGLSAL